MLFGGMIIQILIQAAILQLSLKLIARHEADTSFSKAAMVTAGITVGNFLVVLILAKVFPLLIWPAQIALTAAVIMTFCWISFWKSVVVVLVFVTVQVILAIALFFAFGIGMLSMVAAGAKGAPLNHNQPIDARSEALRQEAARTYQKSLEKQRQLEAEARRIETENSSTYRATPKRTYTPPPPRPSITKKRSDSLIDWKGAEASLRRGGVIEGPQGNYFAMINGELVQKGDTVEIKYKGHVYSWRVSNIRKTDAELEQLEVKAN